MEALMPKTFEATNRSLIDLRDERDDLRIRLSLLQDNRLTTPAELLRLKQEIAVLEKRIANEA